MIAMGAGNRTPRFRDTLVAEWLKAATLRAPYPLLVLATGIAVGVGALLSAASAGDYPGPGAAGGNVFDPVATALSAMPYAGVIIAAIAVTLVTSEYAGGMMRLTLTVTPARWRVLAAKLLATLGPALLAGTLSATLAVAVGLRVLSSRGVPTPPLTGGGVLAAVVGAGVGTALVALIGTCLAVVIRRSAPAVALTNLIAFLPGIGYALPDWWQRHVIAYLPTGASGSLTRTVADHSAAHLSPATAYAVIAGWAVVLVVAGGVALARRDA
jgi:ABC-2 type transport system permease protein